jgi:hypothetical protein
MESEDADNERIGSWLKSSHPPKMGNDRSTPRGRQGQRERQRERQRETERERERARVRESVIHNASVEEPFMIFC